MRLLPSLLPLLLLLSPSLPAVVAGKGKKENSPPSPPSPSPRDRRLSHTSDSSLATSSAPSPSPSPLTPAPTTARPSPAPTPPVAPTTDSPTVTLCPSPTPFPSPSPPYIVAPISSDAPTPTPTPLLPCEVALGPFRGPDASGPACFLGELWFGQNPGTSCSDIATVTREQCDAFGGDGDGPPLVLTFVSTVCNTSPSLPLETPFFYAFNLGRLSPDPVSITTGDFLPLETVQRASCSSPQFFTTSFLPCVMQEVSAFSFVTLVEALNQQLADPNLSCVVRESVEFSVSPPQTPPRTCSESGIATAQDCTTVCGGYSSFTQSPFCVCECLDRSDDRVFSNEGVCEDDPAYSFVTEIGGSMSCSDIGAAAGILGDCYSVYDSNVGRTDPTGALWQEILFACSPTCSACPPEPCVDTPSFIDSFFDEPCDSPDENFGWSDFNFNFCADRLLQTTASYLEPTPLNQTVTTFTNLLRNCPVSCLHCEVFAGSEPAGDNPNEFCYFASFDADVEATGEEFESGQVEHVEYALWQRYAGKDTGTYVSFSSSTKVDYSVASRPTSLSTFVHCLTVLTTSDYMHDVAWRAMEESLGTAEMIPADSPLDFLGTDPLPPATLIAYELCDIVSLNWQMLVDEALNDDLLASLESNLLGERGSATLVSQIELDYSVREESLATFMSCYSVVASAHLISELSPAIASGALNPSGFHSSFIALDAVDAPPFGSRRARRDSSGGANAAIVGVASAGAVMLLAGAIWGMKKRGKREAVLSVSKADSYVDVERNEFEEPASIAPSISPTSLSSFACKCNSQSCGICHNPNGNGSTQFVPVSPNITAFGGLPIRSFDLDVDSPSRDRSQVGFEMPLVVATYDDMNHAMFKGNWALVAAIAEEIESSAQAKKAFARTKAKSKTANRGGEKTFLTGFKSIQAHELDQLLDDDNFELVSKIAHELAEAESEMEMECCIPCTFPFATEDDEERSNLKTSRKDMVEIVARVTELVTKVAPNELEAVDAMLQEFAGREQDLIDQLTNIYERSFATQTRLLSQTQARKEAQKTSRASKAQPRTARPAQNTSRASKAQPRTARPVRPTALTSLDVDDLVYRSDYAKIASIASAPRNFRRLKRGARSKLGEIEALKADLICTLFADNDSAGIIAACTAFAEAQQENEHYASFSDGESK